MDTNDFIEWCITSSPPDALRGFIRANLESAKKWMLEDYLNNTDDEDKPLHRERRARLTQSIETRFGILALGMRGYVDDNDLFRPDHFLDFVKIALSESQYEVLDEG